MRRKIRRLSCEISASSVQEISVLAHLANANHRNQQVIPHQVMSLVIVASTVPYLYKNDWKCVSVDDLQVEIRQILEFILAQKKGERLCRDERGWRAWRNRQFLALRARLQRRTHRQICLGVLLTPTRSLQSPIVSNERRNDNSQVIRNKDRRQKRRQRWNKP